MCVYLCYMSVLFSFCRLMKLTHATMKLTQRIPMQLEYIPRMGVCALRLWKKERWVLFHPRPSSLLGYNADRYHACTAVQYYGYKTVK